MDMSWRESLSILTSPLLHSSHSLPPSHLTVPSKHGFQFFSLFTATVLSPSHSLLLLSESHSFSLHPFISPLPFPLHLPTTHFSGSSIVSQRGTCCYWFLSGDVCGTSVDAICGSVALLMLRALHEQLAGKWDVWRRGPEENGASSSAEMIEWGAEKDREQEISKTKTLQSPKKKESQKHSTIFHIKLQDYQGHLCMKTKTELLYHCCTMMKEHTFFKWNLSVHRSLMFEILHINAEQSLTLFSTYFKNCVWVCAPNRTAMKLRQRKKKKHSCMSEISKKLCLKRIVNIHVCDADSMKLLRL